MRNTLRLALMQYLHNQLELHQQDKEKLDELYTLYQDKSEELLNALNLFSETLLDYAAGKDGEEDLSTSSVIGAMITLQNSLLMLDLTLSAKEKIGDSLYKLALGGKYE